MLSVANRPLPGIRFERRAPQLDEALPRMDVATFVGFAVSGPLHIPVAVEDATQFQSIFGDGPLLAWDPQRGEAVRGLLAPAVKAFFSNGGRRCWIVRVADDRAAYNYFPLPGLAVLHPQGGGKLFPAFARASSQGSWSDGLRISTGVRLRPIQTVAGYDGGEELLLSTESPRPSNGDLLRFSFGHDNEYVMFAVAGANRPQMSSPPPAVTRVSLSHRIWFARFAVASPPVAPIQTRARVYAAVVDDPADPGAVLSTDANRQHPFEKIVPAWIEEIHAAELADAQAANEITVKLAMPPAEAPAPGSLLVLDVFARDAWVVVDGLGFGDDAGSPPGRALRIHGRVWWSVTNPPAELEVSRAEIVSFDLRVRDGDRGVYTLRDLGFAPGHPRYWNALASDEAFFLRDANRGESKRLELAFELAQAATASVSQSLRFPLAGAEDVGAIFIPLALASDLATQLTAVRPTRSALARDGLQDFGTHLFIDPDMLDASVDQFMAQADFLRYLAPSPRPLRGIHAVLGYGDSTIIEEATVIAVPDAVHRRWRAVDSPSEGPPPVLPPIVRPEWWPSLPCDTPQQYPTAREPQTDQFLPCDIRFIAAPLLEALDDVDATGTFTLQWGAAEAERFVLEEDVSPDFESPQLIYKGTQQQLTVYSRSPGDYYYRIRVEVGRNTSDWTALRVSVGDATGYEVESPECYDDQVLVAVHRALLRLCAGRGDLLAVLSVPLHYRERGAIGHTQRLRTLSEDEPQLQTVLALERSELRALSYGALYHPWIIGRQADASLEYMPPDGAACGVLAARAALRGAWIAAANEPLQGVIAIEPGVARARLQPLQDAQVNTVRQEARGFLILSEDTLSTDVDLRPINVRRLLILLRRLALRRGAEYVFEPLSDTFRRTVQRGFEQVMFELFQRGAFAGDVPAASYQVVTAPPVNTAQSLDRGFFFVELKVAPSLPMRFLTVRLLQKGDRLIATEGR